MPFKKKDKKIKKLSYSNKNNILNMKKEILLLIVLIVSGFSIYSLIPIPNNITENNENNRENIRKETSEKIIKKTKKEFLSFDVVRITKNGDAVIAGRTRPNEEIMLFDGEIKIANIISDFNGEWVWTSQIPLKPGIKKLLLRSINNKGEEVQSDQTIFVFLNYSEPKKPLIMKSSNKGTEQSLLLNLEQVSEGIVLDIVEYSPSGSIMLSGRSESDTELTFFLNQKKIGISKTDEWGFWNFKTNKNMEFGKHELRIDLLSRKGALSFSTYIFKEDLTKIINSLDNEKIIVQPGNSLWRIARKTLGGGIFYSEIYNKNKVQIKNPDLIFPGQVFDIPIITGKINYE